MTHNFKISYWNCRNACYFVQKWSKFNAEWYGRHITLDCVTVISALQRVLLSSAVYSRHNTTGSINRTEGVSRFVNKTKKKTIEFKFTSFLVGNTNCLSSWVFLFVLFKGLSNRLIKKKIERSESNSIEPNRTPNFVWVRFPNQSY